MWPRNNGERAMEYYVGLDISLKQTSICVGEPTVTTIRSRILSECRSPAKLHELRGASPER